MTGSFYGPNGDEIGAVFNASGPGGTLTGSLTGQQTALASTSDGASSVTLTAAIKNQGLFNTQSAWLVYQARENETGLSNASVLTSSGAATITPIGVGAASIFSYGYTIDPADRTAGQRANFDTYAKTLAGRPTTVSFYKIGSTNTELALTYTSFFSWTMDETSQIASGQHIYDTNIHFLTYGIKTRDNLMAARTGTARYDGVAYGLGVNMAGTKYDVSGTSRFDVDFSSQAYAGALTLQATPVGGGSVRSLGLTSFASTLVSGNMLRAELPRGGNWGGSNYLQPQFYGPMGQEIGATFQMMTGPQEDANTLFIAGAAVAKSP
jgi:hypothetical protein